MLCPECNQNDFCSWNTLHTHLWRQHKIDMELYSCEFCSFKTPILSRLTNTHIKIHSDDRNFKCDQCNKAFKNSKQLKDHRRLHRLSTLPQEAHVCQECNSSFGRLKTLREHIKKKHTEKEGSTTDVNATRLQCDRCSYDTVDHNALRRHKMTHENGKQYQCQFCDYMCIQSTMYQKHIRQRHPEHASEVILQCAHCNFCTINRRYYNVHIAKHKNVSAPEMNTSSCDNAQDCSDDREEETSMQAAYVLAEAVSGSFDKDDYQIMDLDRSSVIDLYDDSNSLRILDLDHNSIHCEVDNRHKIKVKSDSVLTDPSKFCTLEPIPIPDLQIL